RAERRLLRVPHQARPLALGRDPVDEGPVHVLPSEGRSPVDVDAEEALASRGDGEGRIRDDLRPHLPGAREEERRHDGESMIESHSSSCSGSCPRGRGGLAAAVRGDVPPHGRAMVRGWSATVRVPVTETAPLALAGPSRWTLPSIRRAGRAPARVASTPRIRSVPPTSSPSTATSPA